MRQRHNSVQHNYSPHLSPKPRSMTGPPKPSPISISQSSTQEYAAVCKALTPPLESPTSSKITTTFGAVTETVNSDYAEKIKSKPTRKLCDHPSLTTPDFMELEDTAEAVKQSIHILRNDLASLRKFQIDNAKNFKADIQKKLLEFRKKAAKVDDIIQQKLDINNNFIFGKKLLLFYTV